MVWCMTVLDKTLSAHEIKSKVNTLEVYARKTFPKSGCFTLEWLGKVIRKIDELWYDNKLLKELTRVYGGLHIHKTISERKIAGYVLESDEGDSIALHMNRNLFASLFGKKETGYHSGGLLCRNKLNCLLHVLLHETVHLVLTLCDRTGHREDIRDHGREFNKIVKHLFGQTDSQHGLIDGYDQYHDLETIRSRLKKGTKVQVFIDGTWVPGHVKKKGYKWVDVSCKKGSYTVHAGLLRFPSK